MSKITWLYEDEPDYQPEYDLVGRTADGVTCDVVHNFKNKWSAVVGLVRIGEYDTRELGRKACEDYIAKF
jgi:hypothetical protein